MDNKRQHQISALIQRNFSSVLIKEGFNIYGNAMVSVTAVRISPDLSQAKIYLSIYNASDKEVILRKISNHTHTLKQELAKEIKHQVRRIPQIYFYLDETIDELYKVDQLIKDVKVKYPYSTWEEE